jgi:hypothetical protein
LRAAKDRRGNTAIAETFLERAHLRIGADLFLQLPSGDQDAFNLLIEGQAHAALLPRPFGFIAEERGFKRIEEWPKLSMPVAHHDRNDSQIMERTREGVENFSERATVKEFSISKRTAPMAS